MFLVNARRLGRVRFSCDQLRNEALISLLVNCSASFNRRVCGSVGSCTVFRSVGLSPLFVIVPVGLLVLASRAGASMTVFQIRVGHAWLAGGCMHVGHLKVGRAYSQYP